MDGIVSKWLTNIQIQLPIMNIWDKRKIPMVILNQAYIRKCSN